jgi:acetylornithine/succinyldiaminopimelate/putrescine aminotransferase
MDSFKDNPILGHITTFGGHPLSCAASLGAIQAIEEGDLIRHIPEKEALFRKLLQHPKIKSVSGAGLMLAMQLESFEEVEQLMHKSLDKGVITDWFLFQNTAIRISPPLTISRDEIEFACRAIVACLSE